MLKSEPKTDFRTLYSRKEKFKNIDMKKTVFLSALILLTVFAPQSRAIAFSFAGAHEVDSLEAKRIAQSVLSSQGVKSELHNITPATWEGTLYLYTTGQKDFVLLSADDAVKPILAYSTDSPFPTDSLPPQVQALIQSYIDIVDYARQNNLPQHPAWKQVQSSKDGTGVVPMLTSTWNQYYPYNALCPPAPTWGNALSITGCVATAMAQIMRYWQWPEIGWGQYEYDETWTRIFSDGSYLLDTTLVSEQFDTVHYQWNLMPDALGASSSDAEIYAVARLMFDCGVATETRYSPEASGALIRSTTEPSAEQALLTHFRYYPTLHCVSRSQYTDSEWLDLMQSELDAARPILYSAGGHALVADGYDGDRRLHFNLGWGGQCNGFYTIDDLCLASGLSPYTPHEAIIGIRPNTDNVDTAIVQGVASDTLGGYCTGNGEYPYGQLVSLMAHTAEGYRFDGWTSGHLDNPRHFPATIHFSDTALIHSIASDTLYYCTPIEDNNWDHNTVGTITRLGIRIPSSSLHGERAVYAVQFYKNLPSFRIMNLYIHSGATPPEEDSSSFRHTFLAPRYAVGWITLNLDSSVVIDTTADLWIVFEDENGIIEDLYGHTTYGGNSDGCWYRNETGWHTLDSIGLWSTWRIRVLTSSYSDPAAIQPVADDSPVAIYVDNGRIIVTDADDETVQVFDILGRQIQAFKQSSNQTIASGVYMVKVGPRPAQKVVVTRN